MVLGPLLVMELRLALWFPAGMNPDLNPAIAQAPHQQEPTNPLGPPVQQPFPTLSPTVVRWQVPNLKPGSMARVSDLRGASQSGLGM
ncbi:MAG: hypothetical protein O3A14_12365 [Cyanobacteria bacterium]|nr:hypothetical protein [Cyanobacteriota bacterium]